MKVIDRVSNEGWKVRGRSDNTSKNKPLISMYRAIDYTTGTVPDGTLESSWKASKTRVNPSALVLGTPGAKHRSAVAAAPTNTSLASAEISVPNNTSLLPNYPNPFNPETWIPYQLATPTAVNIDIYAVDGTRVRQLRLGHQPPGVYQSRSRAVYWGGKNALGEPVASGVYFYTFTAGDFTATRKMLIRK